MSTTEAPAGPSIVLQLPLDKYPSMNSFALDFVRDTPSALRFCARETADRIAPPGKERGRDEVVAALAKQNAEWGNDVARQLQSWNEGQTVGVIAGQQVGFAGGPLLILAKIASLMQLRERFDRKGVPATIFFWLATEDHDYDEVAALTLALPERRATLRARERPAVRHVVGALPLPQSLRRGLLEAITFSSTPRWLREGITFRDSFAELLTDVFHGRGLVLVDSLLPELRVAGRPLFRDVLEKESEIQSALGDRSQQLEEAGYPPQVVPGEEGDYSLLYRIDRQGIRQPIRRVASGGFTIGSEPIEKEELLRVAGEDPQSISTGVLTRPLLQDFVFRPEVFVGGPAEVSYYAQIAPLHQLLKIKPPRVMLRGHTLVTSARNLRAVERYGLRTEELFSDAETIIAAHDPQAVARLEESIDLSRAEIEERLGNMREAIVSTEPALERSVDRTLRRTRFHLDTLKRRGRMAAIRKNSERYRAVSRLLDALVPGGVPQDRQTSWLLLWRQWGDLLIRRIVEAVEPDADVVTIVGL